MNKYVLMMAAAGLIAAAPVYYAFQAQAEEAPVTEEAAPAGDEAAPAAPAAEGAAEAPATTEEAAPTVSGFPAADEQAGEEAPAEDVHDAH